MAHLMRGSALLVCCCCCQGLLAAAAIILGVEPGAESRYQGDTFQCKGFDGHMRALPASSVNDDACDCMDGSDEPGTGACAGQDTTLFFCANEGSIARRIYASRVDDGLCDCCDGSDEATLAKRFPDSACPNKCAEEGAAGKQEAEQKVSLLREALQKQEEIRQGGLEKRATWKAELEQLNSQLTDFQTAFDTAKEVADAARAAEAERKKAEEAAKNASSTESSSGTCMWRQTAGCDPHGAPENEHDKPCDEMIPPGISGFCDCNGDGKMDDTEIGFACESAEVGDGIVCKDLCQVSTEETVEETKKEADEKPAVSEYSKWMDGAAETLSAEDGKTAEGGEEKQVSEYAKWMEGAEAAGAGGEAETAAPEAEAPKETESDLTQPVQTKFEEDPEAPPPKEKTPEELETEAKDKLDSHKDSISNLESQIESLASDDHLGFADLAGKTLEKHISEWDYKLEFFKSAMQDYTSLGTWSKWTGRTSAVFDKGNMCWGGPARKLNVNFQCALNQELVDVFEPSRCVYEATVKHPGACDAQELEILEKGTRILGPHDEL